MSFNFSNLAQKTAKTARDKAITAAKQIAKDEVKEYVRDTKEQFTGLPTSEIPTNKQTEYYPNEQEINAKQIAAHAQDRERWGELRNLLDQELLKARQARIQREQQRMQEIQMEAQKAREGHEKAEILPTSMPKRKGLVGRAAQAIKNKLSSSTSKAEKQRNVSG
jgi:hypothetical protein